MAATLDINECAAFLKVDRTTALELAGNGVLPGAKIGRAWVFLEEDLVDYLRAEARRQARERQAKSAIDKELKEVSAEQMPVAQSAPKRRGKTLDLSGYALP